MADEDDRRPRRSRSRSRQLPPLNDEEDQPNVDAAGTDGGDPPRRRRRRPRPPPADEQDSFQPADTAGTGQSPTGVVDSEGAGGEENPKRRRRRRRPQPEGEETLVDEPQPDPQTTPARREPTGPKGEYVGVAAGLKPLLNQGIITEVAPFTLSRLHGSRRRDGSLPPPTAVAQTPEPPSLDISGTPRGLPGAVSSASEPGGDSAPPKGGHASMLVAKHAGEPQYMSEPANKVYIEHKSGFRSETMDEFHQRLQEERANRYPTDAELNQQVTSNLTREFAVKFQRAWRNFCTILHGLFAGLAIMHTVFVFMITQKTSALEFIQIYGESVRTMSVVYYIFYCFCLISAFDRYDLGRPTRECFRRCASCKIGGIVVVIYIASMLVNQSMFPQENLLHLSTVNATYRTAALNSTLEVWRILDAVRASTLAIAWLVIAVSPIYDRLEENLTSDMDDFITDENPTEVVAMS